MAMTQAEVEYRILEMAKQITNLNHLMTKLTPSLQTRQLSEVTEQELIELRNQLAAVIIDVQNLQSQI